MTGVAACTPSFVKIAVSCKPIRAPARGPTRACLAIPSVRESRIPKGVSGSGRSAMYVLRQVRSQSRPVRSKQVVAKETQAAAAGTGSRRQAAPIQAPALIPRRSRNKRCRGFTCGGGHVDTAPRPPFRSAMSPSWEPPAGAPRRETGSRSDTRQQRRCGCA